MVDKKELTNFIIKAKRNTWAANAEPVGSRITGFKRYIFSNGDWIYEDNYKGFSVFWGFELVRFKREFVWQMHYRGKVNGQILQSEEDKKLYDAFLKDQLKRVPIEFPFRGPHLPIPGHIKDVGFEYSNQPEGDITEFKGIEYIHKTSPDSPLAKKVHELTYGGGLIVPK